MDEKARILIVDDDKSVSKSLSLVLEKKGYCTQWAGTGKEALAKAKESAFNVALIDLKLPDMSGVELVEPLKKLNPDTALMIVTGYASLDTSVQAVDKGVSAYLIKPLNIDEVLQRVGDILTRQGLIGEKRQAEQALKDSEGRYRGLFENSSEFLFTLDLEGSFTSVNKAASKLTGYTKSELLKMNFKDYTPRSDHRELFRAFYNVFKTGKPLKDFPVKAIIKDKTEKYFETSLSPLKKGDEIIGFQGSSKDITERKRSEEELRQSHAQLQRTLGGTVNALASTVEMRDPYTAGHQRRVTELACAVAEEMGLSEEQIEGLRMAGLIHDIGKINVPAEILSKPSRLNDTEFSLIKAHSQAGYDILKTIEFPWPVAQIVLQHHERMDGSGYPTGLKGDEILLEARIIAVADVVEAMASHRPYRPARGIDKALGEIAQNKGKLYDPRIVDACLKVFTEGRFKFES